MYIYTVNDHYDRVAQQIWDASKNDNIEAFGECINKLKKLKLIATARSEFAKAALQGLCADSDMDPRPSAVAQIAFQIADAMLAEEAKPR